MENGKEPTAKAPPVRSKVPTIGDLVGQALFAFCIGALLGVAYHYYSSHVSRLFE